MAAGWKVRRTSQEEDIKTRLEEPIVAPTTSFLSYQVGRYLNRVGKA